MTPLQARYSQRDLRAVEPPAKEPTLKWETARMIGAMLLAGVVSYYATIYGLREDVAVLKAEVRQLVKAVDKQTDTILDLTKAVSAFTAAHKGSVP